MSGAGSIHAVNEEDELYAGLERAVGGYGSVGQEFEKALDRAPKGKGL